MHYRSLNGKPDIGEIGIGGHIGTQTPAGGAPG
jgi:hypothetical protein